MTRMTTLLLLLVTLFSVSTAFQRTLPLGRVQTFTKTSLRPSLQTLNVVKSSFVQQDNQLFPSTSALSASEGSLSTDTSNEAKKTFTDTIWNEKTKIIFYLTVWYMGNIYYNIYNKKACMALGSTAAGHANCHWALAAVQLLVGVLLVLPMWATGLRTAPKLTLENWKELSPVGLWAAMAHSFSVIALGAGAVSFTQIIKAGEPVFAAATNALVLKDIDHPMVYVALLPIIAGVGLASLKELSFSWTSLIFAALSNQAAANKNVVSKGVMSKPWAKALGPQNTFAIITIIALLITIPIAIFFDAKEIPHVYQQIVARGATKDVIKYSFLSGLTFYLYNEASFQALERLSPVTHSVANTVKRVVIIVAACMVFKTPITLLGSVGSGIAVLGTLIYSLAKKAYSTKPPAPATTTDNQHKQH